MFCIKSFFLTGAISYHFLTHENQTALKKRFPLCDAIDAIRLSCYITGIPYILEDGFMDLKKVLFSLLSLCLTVSLLGALPVPTQAADNTAVQTTNVVIVVDFADTVHTDHPAYSCLSKAPSSVVDSFTGDYARSMKNYISAISCGRLQVINVFPQYNETDTALQIYKLPHNEDYYVDQGMQNIGSAIIRDILRDLQRDLSVCNDLDLEQDGEIDNLTLVIPSDSSGRAPIDSHQSRYFGDEKVNGLRIGNYVVLSEYDLALGASVASHEFLHTRGYPDLYVSGGRDSGCNPVGPWCCMSTTAYNYPLAYLRSAISGWLSIPTVTTSTEHYRLRAATATDDTDPVPQAVILKTDLCSTEFFVVEYRRKSDELRGLDHHIPGSGLIVYRVNLLSDSNFFGPPYMVYLFRPGDSYAEGHELCGGDTYSAFLSAESGRTGYGSADLSATLESGALTYSDGRNSGIVISNVGSASDDTITFDISYTELPNGSYWDTVGSSAVSSTITDFYWDPDGTLYYLESEHCNVSPSDIYLARFSDTGPARLSAALSTGTATRLFLQKYGSDFYVSYYSGGTANLAKWDGDKWTPLYSAEANDMDMTADDSGVYLTYSSADNSTVYVYRHTASGGGLLGTSAAAGGYAANLSVTAEGGTVAVAYRDFYLNDCVYVKVYGADQTWADVSPANCASSGGAVVKLHGGALYLLTSGSQGNLLYCRSLHPGSAWTRSGDAYAPVSIIDQQLCFVDDLPCVLYKRSTSQETVSRLEAVQLIDGVFEPIGGYLVSDRGISSQRLHTCGGKLYTAYLSGDGYDAKLLSVKSYTLRAETVPTRPDPFMDVTPGEHSYYYTPVLWALDAGITTGKTETTFAPFEECTRSQVVTFLWRAAGSPAPVAKTSPFADVQDPGAFYYQAVLWAAENGITTGTDATHFSPDLPVTRGQFVTFLWRHAGKPGHGGDNPFRDIDPDSFYCDAVLWASEFGITNGMGSGEFVPEGICQRGQTVTFLYRYYSNTAR